MSSSKRAQCRCSSESASTRAFSIHPSSVRAQTLLTHARLVRRWFGQHAAEVGRGVSGDPYLMLGELLERRQHEADGSDEALLEAGERAWRFGRAVSRNRFGFLIHLNVVQLQEQGKAGNALLYRSLRGHAFLWALLGLGDPKPLTYLAKL